MPLLAIGVPGPLELLIILLIVLVVFGASRLPGVGSALGSGIRMFKSGLTGDDEKSTTDKNSADRPTDETRA